MGLLGIITDSVVRFMHRISAISIVPSILYHTRQPHINGGLRKKHVCNPHADDHIYHKIFFQRLNWTFLARSRDSIDSKREACLHPEALVPECLRSESHLPTLQDHGYAFRTAFNHAAIDQVINITSL